MLAIHDQTIGNVHDIGAWRIASVRSIERAAPTRIAGDKFWWLRPNLFIGLEDYLAMPDF